MSAEEDHLPTHVAVCAERYKGIAARIDSLKTRFGRFEIILYGLLALTAFNGDGPLTKMIFSVLGK